MKKNVLTVNYNRKESKRILKRSCDGKNVLIVNYNRKETKRILEDA